MCIAANISGGSFLSALCSVSELLLIFGISSAVSAKSRTLGYLTNVLLCIIFSIQCLILFFSGEFLSPLMIENTGMADNLGDNIATYAIGAVIAISVSFIPSSVKPESSSHEKTCKRTAVISSMLYCTFLFTGVLTERRAVSPVSALAVTSFKMAKNHIFTLSNRGTDRKDIMDSFYRDSISTGFSSYGSVTPPPSERHCHFH